MRLYHGSNVRIDKVDLCIMSNDVQFQIECLTRDLILMTAAAFGWSSEKAMDVVYSSDTFAKLENPKTGLFYQSAAYAFSYLRHELQKAQGQ